MDAIDAIVTSRLERKQKINYLEDQMIHHTAQLTTIGESRVGVALACLIDKEREELKKLLTASL